MADFTLHYWPIPFRGQPIRAVLAHVGATWREAGFDATLAERGADVSAQLIPHMGPPVLSDHGAGVHISQMPAILAYLGEIHGLFPDGAVSRALCHKVIGDGSDVLYEMTRHHGVRMWSKAAWRDYQPRLRRWMAIFEETGRRHGLTGGAGFMLGTPAPCLADLVTATIWGTMMAKLPGLRPMLEGQAPGVAGLCDRIGALPAQVALRRQSDAAYGDDWCGGQIEASLRAALGQQVAGRMRPGAAAQVLP